MICNTVLPSLPICYSTTFLLTTSRDGNKPDYHGCNISHTSQKLNTWAFHIHEVAVRVLNQSLELVSSTLLLRSGVQKITGELKVTKKCLKSKEHTSLKDNQVKVM